MYHFALLSIQDIFMLTPVFKPVHMIHTHDYNLLQRLFHVADWYLEPWMCVLWYCKHEIQRGGNGSHVSAVSSHGWQGKSSSYELLYPLCCQISFSATNQIVCCSLSFYFSGHGSFCYWFIQPQTITTWRTQSFKLNKIRFLVNVVWSADAVFVVVVVIECVCARASACMHVSERERGSTCIILNTFNNNTSDFF